MQPVQIRSLRQSLGLTQQEFADQLGVSFVTLNRWENDKAKPSPLAVKKIREISEATAPRKTAATAKPRLDFLGNPKAFKVYVEGERLTFGHQFNPAFATEISRIDPLPHQRIAVYERMLPQERLRFLLADDAGAGKTIMTGLYVRECLSRRTLRRILIVVPAGLVGNWHRELRSLFQLNFTIVRSADARNANPFIGEGSDLVLASVDSLCAERLFACLKDPGVDPYDLVVFDEAHKLSASRDGDGTLRRTKRYRLAEAVAGVRPLSFDWQLPWCAHNLVLLTATPHMGKDFPYYCLWRLLEPEALSTQSAFTDIEPGWRDAHFIRRVKEEMVDFDGKALFPQRVCDTVQYDLSQGDVSEQALYDETTAYISNYYNQARLLNRQAARFAMTVFQRRLASSTWALLRSLRNRMHKLERLIDDLKSSRVDEAKLRQQQQKLDELEDVLDSKTADEEDVSEQGEEEHESSEAEALGAFVSINLAELNDERGQLARLTQLAEAVYATRSESKFDRMRDLIDSSEHEEEKIIIYTEHKDTLDFLVQRLEGMGYAGQVACLHGGMDFRKRDLEVERFRRSHQSGGDGARFFIGTDAAAEGINLQFCSTLINYDIPWNPSRLEQRMGRIHRYGQQRDRVHIINLVAGNTREGNVVKTLLDKLEEIRRQLGNDKVFDVIGRIFEGMELIKYMRRILDSNSGQDVDGSEIESLITAHRVTDLKSREEHLYGITGEVSESLPQLQSEIATQKLLRLLPGYLRIYLENAAPFIGVDLVGDLGGQFLLRPRQTGVLERLAPAIEAHSETTSERFTLFPGTNPIDAIFLHPGEPIFDELQSMARDACRASALRGAMFTDQDADTPYLLYFARIHVERASCDDVPELRKSKCIEQRLVSVRQFPDGHMSIAPVEHLLTLQPAERLSPASHSLFSEAHERVGRAEAHFQAYACDEIVSKQRDAADERLIESTSRVRRAFDLQASQLAAERKRIGAKVKQGHSDASNELERIKQDQRALSERRELALHTARQTVDLIGLGSLDIIAIALVQPAEATDETGPLAIESERIAVEMAVAFERARGAEVFDVSTADRARKAGLNDYPGFDLLSKHPEGDRSIEVKGRAGRTDVALEENEWAAACNLQDSYWLYCVFDCGTAAPKLLKVQNPFRKLVAKSRGRLIVAYGEVIREAEEDETNDSAE